MSIDWFFLGYLYRKLRVQRVCTWWFCFYRHNCFESFRNPSALGLLLLDTVDVDIYLTVVEASKADDTQ